MAVTEVRTQVYLPRKLHLALQRAARARGVSMAQLLREAAEEIVRREGRTTEDPFGGLVGAMRDAPPDLSENHDHYLYGSPRRSG
jgi:hypothetical protein